MNIINNIYIYNVDTHETIQSNENIEKSLSGKSSFRSSTCVMVLCYGPFSCNLILRVPLTVKYFFIVPQFLGFISQASIIRIQTH